MKKLIPGFICLLLIASIASIASCGFENLPPKALVVKGNPGLYVPIGSPFAGMEKEKRVEYLLSPDNLKKEIKENATNEGADEDVKIYVSSENAVINLKNKLKEYNMPDMGIDTSVQAYMLHYPLLKMPLNLKRQTDDAMRTVKEKRTITIPDNTVGLPLAPSTPLYVYYDETDKTPKLSQAPDPDIPFLKIPFTKMSKLVKKVGDGKYGLEIDPGNNTALAANLEIKIPGFGFNYMRGKLTSDGKLQYYADGINDPDKTEFYPQKRDPLPPNNVSDLDDGENLYIYARITGNCSGALELSMIFDWTYAIIDTKSSEDLSTYMGSYPINNKLSEFVGEGVTFKKVVGFMYMSGVEEGKGSFTAKIYKSEVFNDGRPSGEPKKTYTEPLREQNMPGLPLNDNEEFKETFYPMSIVNKENTSKPGEPMDLTGIFDSNETTLQYAINIDEMLYHHNDNDQDYIVFDLIILIPMDLKISKPVESADESINKNYVKLDFGQSFKNTLWEGDLFGSKKEGGKDKDNYLKNIDYINVGIRFSETDINIITPEKLAILAETKKDSKYMEFKNNASMKLIGGSSDGTLLSPAFSVILKKDPGENFGSFRLFRPAEPKFDFKLYVEAKAKLEYKMDF